MNEEMELICIDVFLKSGKKFDIELIRSKTRLQEVVGLRRQVCAILREHGFSFVDIGKFIDRSHCSVLWHCKKTNSFKGIKKQTITKGQLLLRLIRRYEVRIAELKQELHKLNQ